MEIILAENHGFCYGVKRAVEMANEAANSDGKSYTLGPIIHNPQVVGRLESKGVSPIQEVADIDEGTMIIRSHGVGPAIYAEAEEKGLHILDATADAIKSRGLNKVALLGTKFTMSDNFYRDGLIVRGITPIVPNESAQNEIHRIIFDELCVGKFLPQSKAFYLDTIEFLRKQGAEGVILGCTEIGLLVNQSDFSLPFFDTAKLHSQMAAEFVLK